MQELFVRTLSQGLQAFMPVGLFLSYARTRGRAGLIGSARWAMAAALLLTFPVGSLFQRATHQAAIEALLAGATVAFTIWFVRSIRSEALRAVRSRQRRAHPDPRPPDDGDRSRAVGGIRRAAIA
jgi:hypothetical protein